MESANKNIPSFFENESDAKKKAKETLTKIFENKMLNIDTIKSILSEFHKIENQYSLEVFNRIERNIKESDESIKNINVVIQSTNELKKNFEMHMREWNKITNALNQYGENLEHLMNSKRNISMMRHNLSIYVRIKDQINELRDLINKSDSNVVIVYKQIRYLSYLRQVLLDKVKKVSRTEKLNNLADHLLCVQQFNEEFFNKFWKYFENYLEWAVNKPEFLVKLIRLIEEDAEYMKTIKSQLQIIDSKDSKLDGLQNSLRGTITPRESTINDNETGETMPENLIDRLRQFTEDKFHEAFLGKIELNQVLECAQPLLAELSTIQQKVVPCFPPKYDIFNFLSEMYLNQVYNRIKPFLVEEELAKTPKDLIDLAKYLEIFKEHLRKVGIDIKNISLGAEVEFYMHLFYDHVNERLQENVNAILMKNKQDKLSLIDYKGGYEKIESHYSSDIFNTLLRVIETLAVNIHGQLLFQIIKISVDKLQSIQKETDEDIKELCSSEQFIIACVSISDAQNCIEAFPSFKKKSKEMLPKEYYERLKFYLRNATSTFNNSIKLGANKSIELFFIDLEKEFFRKIFTTEWTDEVLDQVFGTFRTIFNQGYVKILKGNQSNLTMVIRTFIDYFINFYLEELIHSIRSANRKRLTNDSDLCKYKPKYLKIFSNSLKYDVKRELVEPTEARSRIGTVTNVKNLDVYACNKKEEVKYKKYTFPVKKFDEKSKKLTMATVYNRINEDMVLFTNFLNSFKEGAAEPFSKYFTQTLGQNYINTFLNKFNSLLDILKCTENTLKDSINYLFKESFSGFEGKVLLEALLYIREDNKITTRPDLRKYFLNLFENN